MDPWHAYLIRCKDNSLYAGITTDVSRRFTEHQNHPLKGAKYLKGKGPLILAWQAEIGNRNTALKVERKIKTLPKAAKEKLVKGEINIQDIVRTVSSTDNS